MSDNEDLLGDDLGDQSLADYNLGNEEEEQLLADDYDTGAQNVPTSLGVQYEPEIAPEYPTHPIEYSQPIPYQPVVEPECVVPNITVEVPNPRPEIPHCTYAPYEPVYEPDRTVPPAIPAAPIESPQIVPSELNPMIANGDLARERFISERPPGSQRLPQIRDIPDTLDKVVVPRGRGRGGWMPRHRHRVLHRANYNPRMSFQPPQMHIRPDMPMRPKMRPDIPPEILQPVGPEISPDRPVVPELMQFRPQFPPFQYRPNMDDRPTFSGNMRPNFEPRHMFPYPRTYRPYPPPREMGPNPGIPQVTIHQAMPVGVPDKPKEPEVRMLPVQLPVQLPPGGLAGKKVLINPHFKGNFQPPVEGLPAYIPTRISKSPPPINPTLESKFGPIKDIDDAAERFIAEQRNALARAANRKFTRRSPLRFIENTTIEIENDLAHRAVRRRSEDDDLLRRQEEFINANRAGLRRRMRSPSPRPSPERRPRPEPPRHYDEESDYKRRLREQESLRERVLRAKEVRRRKNAVALHNKIQEKEKDLADKEKEKEPLQPEKPVEVKPEPVIDNPTSTEPEPKPDTTRKTPEKAERVEKIEKPEKVDRPVKPERVRERSPLKKEESVEVNSTCESLTPPREVALTPPLPDDDDDLDMILGDIDGILSDDDDTGRFKQKLDKPEPAKVTTKPSVDLRSKLPPKTSSSSDAKKAQRQKIVFNDNEDKKKKDKSPPRKAVVTSTKNDDLDIADKRQTQKYEMSAQKHRQKIVFDKEEKQKEENDRKFANRRVILQRRVTQKEKFRTESDPTQPTLGIFSRAVRTAVRCSDEPRVDIALEDDPPTPQGRARPPSTSMAAVTNLPPGITDTRLKTLAGNDVQSLVLDKEERSAKITFKTPAAAENFKRKFNNKMVAASRLTVTLR